MSNHTGEKEMATMTTNAFQSDIETMEHSRVKWGSIIAGVLLAMAVQVALTLFGLAIGLSAFNPAAAGNVSGLGMGTGIWLFISTLISLFLGSIVASWFGATHHRDSSLLHGILVWGLFLLLSMSMLGSGVGAIAGGAFNLMSAGVSGGMSQGAIVNNSGVQKTIAGTFAVMGPASQELANMAMPAVDKAQLTRKMAAGDETASARIVTWYSSLSQPQALDLVRRARQENVTTAQKVTTTAGKAAWIAFGAVLLSFIVSAIGGVLGGRWTNVLANSYRYVPQ
jgi:hypothetical protein